MATPLRKQTSKEYLNSLSILHLALMAGQLMFAGVTYFLHQSEGFEPPASELSPILKVLVPIFVSSAIVGSYFLFNFKVNASREKKALLDKLVDYRIALVLKLAVLEGASLFSTMSYLLTKDLLFLAMTALVVLVFVLQRPTLGNIVEALRLIPQEKQTLEKPDAVVIE
mgnify:CR=1 FL=1